MVMQYEVYEAVDEHLARPEWQINLRWFCALLSIIVLALTLAALSLWRASRADVALPLLQGALVTAFFPQGVEPAQLEQWQQQSAAISAIPLLEGIDLAYVPEDIRGLSAREASLALLQPLSEAVLAQGVSQGLSVVTDEALRATLQARAEQSLRAAVQESLAQVFFAGGLEEVGEVGQVGGLRAETLERWQQRLIDAQKNSLPLLDGVALTFEADALDGLDAEQASLKLIQPLLDALETEGAQAAFDYIEDERLRARLRQRMGSEGIEALNKVWLQELFPQGISSSERSAWRAQLSASPYISVELAPGLTVSLTRDALNNDGLDKAFQERLEPISRAYLNAGQTAALASLDNASAKEAFSNAMPAALMALRRLLVEEIYPTGLSDDVRWQLWRSRLADVGQGSIALIPDIPQRYQAKDLANLEPLQAERVLLEPLMQAFLDQGQFASVRMIADAELSATILDSYAGIEDTLSYALALELFGEVDDETRLQDWRQQLDAPNQWVEGLPSYLSQPLSSAWLENLSPREAALQLVQPLAQAMYQADKQQLYDEAMQQRLQRYLEPLSFVLPRGRQFVLWTLVALIVLTSLTIFMCLWLSDGLSTLANLGLIMFFAALPVALLSWWLQLQLRHNLVTQPPQQQNQPLWHYLQDYSGYMLGFVPPHGINFMSQLHIGLLVCGLLLFLIALSLGLGQRWQQRSL